MAHSPCHLEVPNIGKRTRSFKDGRDQSLLIFWNYCKFLSSEESYRINLLKVLHSSGTWCNSSSLVSKTYSQNLCSISMQHLLERIRESLRILLIIIIDFIRKLFPRTESTWTV